MAAFVRATKPLTAAASAPGAAGAPRPLTLVTAPATASDEALPGAGGAAGGACCGPDCCS